MQDPIFEQVQTLESDKERANRLEADNKRLQQLLYEANKKLLEKDAIIAQKDEEINLAGKDGLTDLPLRKRGMEEMTKEIGREKRGDADLLCMMFDLDNFKMINDTFGHPAGDAVLKAFANVIRQVAREEDLYFRYGGEEFVVVIPTNHQLSNEEVNVITKRYVEETRKISRSGNGIRYKGVEEEFTTEDPIPLDEQGQPRQRIEATDPLTVSLGAIIAPNGLEDLTPEKLIAQADRNLYESKQTGKNKATVSVYNPQIK